MDAVTPKPTSPADLRSHHVRVGEMEWQKTRFPGCEVKTLLFDRDCGLVTALMRFAPSPQSPAPFLGEGAGPQGGEGMWPRVHFRELLEGRPSRRRFCGRGETSGCAQPGMKT